MVTEVKVPEYAARLEDRLKLEGPLTIEEISAWLSEEGAEQKQINLVLGYGSARGKKAWHREGETLIPGPRPGGGQPVAGRHRGPDSIPTVDEAMDRPTGQSKFQGLLESIGVDESQAKMAGNFCFNAFDMENPTEIWQALRECPQIGQPVIKKQVWRLWTRTLRVDLPDTLVQEVATWGRSQASQPAQVGRKFFALDGQVVPTTPDDPEGMSMGDAHRLASLQKGDRPRDEQAGGGVVTTLLQQQGETDRERLKLEAQKGRPEGESVTAAVINQFGELVKSSLNKPPDSSIEARIESQRRESEARAEAQNQRYIDMMERQDERHKHMLDMINQANTHALDLIRLTMEGNNDRPSFIQQLEGALSNKVIADFLKPPAPSTPMITGPGGAMTLETYKAIREMDLKSEALSFAKTTVPDLIKTAVDMTQATRELAASRGHTVDEDQPDDKLVLMQSDCVHCGQSMEYHAGSAILVCPYCRTPQTADGRLMVPQGPPADLEEPTTIEGTVIQKKPEPTLYEETEYPSTVEGEESPLLLGSYFLQPAVRPAPQKPPTETASEGVSNPTEPGPEVSELEPVPAGAD